MAHANAFIATSYETAIAIIIDTPKLVKPQLVIFFRRVFIKILPQYFKNLKKLVCVFLQTKDLSLILLVMILIFKAMCEFKLLEKTNSQKLMDALGLELLKL